MYCIQGIWGDVGIKGGQRSFEMDLIMSIDHMLGNLVINMSQEILATWNVYGLEEVVRNSQICLTSSIVGALTMAGN